MTHAVSGELSASLEDYLEAIFRVIEKKQAARATDIAERLHVGRSSVTGALRALAERELINYAPYDLITLTDKGRRVAADVVRRHEVLRDFFVKVLAVPDADAEAAACRMEHAVPEGVLQRFIEFVEFVERCPRGGAKWIKGFSYHCTEASSASACEKCVSQVFEDIRSDRMTQPAQGSSGVPLSTLKPGQKGVILKVGGEPAVRRRLLDMGATARATVEVERVAPLGDPMEVKVKGYHLTLRKEEAQGVRVEVTRA